MATLLQVTCGLNNLMLPLPTDTRLLLLTTLLLLLQGARGLEVVKNQLDLLSQLSHAGPPASVRQAAQHFVLLQPIARLAANRVSSTARSDAVVKAGPLGAP